MSSVVEVCAVVPTYDNPRTVAAVVETLGAHGLAVVLIDDGSAAEGRAACAALGASGAATVRRHDRNRGKGAAVKTGFAVARELGFSHALQVDADGQHDLGRVPEFVAAARAAPEALVLGYPQYDETVPRVRAVGRRFTTMWVALEVGRQVTVADAMIGFRVYPLAAVERLGRTGDRMGFDVEVIVRLVRCGTPVVNLPVAVRYLTPEAGGVSHFRPLRDNLAFAWLHARLCTAGSVGWLWDSVTGRRRTADAG